MSACTPVYLLVRFNSSSLHKIIRPADFAIQISKFVAILLPISMFFADLLQHTPLRESKNENIANAIKFGFIGVVEWKGGRSRRAAKDDNNVDERPCAVTDST